MSKFVKNEENANRILEWLDVGAPHTVFSLDIAVGSYEKWADDVPNNNLPEDTSSCGAVACMAGAAYQMASGTFGDVITRDWETPAWKDVQEKAIEFLGIDIDLLSEQNEPTMLDVFSPIAAEELGGISQVTGEQAAKALRNFIETGNPNWEEIGENHNG